MPALQARRLRSALAPPVHEDREVARLWSALANLRPRNHRWQQTHAARAMS